MEIDVEWVSGVLLPDGWHVVTGAQIEFDVTLTDAVHGTPPATPAGGAWAVFTDDQGCTIACPVDRIQAIKHTPAPLGLGGAPVVTP